MKPIVIIPARMAATRLPNKPLADIHGMPMIVHTLNRALEADIGRVIVAAGEQEIVDIIHDVGGEAILTPPDLPSGSDRVYHAFSRLSDADAYTIIVNLQGDLPTLDPTLIHAVLEPLSAEKVDIATLAAKIIDEDEKNNPNVVKVVMSGLDKSQEIGRALYFTRATAPWGQVDLLHHIGIYAYKKEALKRFIYLPPSPLEIREKLEQLRALENGMRIDVSIVNTMPLGVDTFEDLEKARAILARNKNG